MNTAPTKMKPTIINLFWKELGYPRQNFWASAEAQAGAEISKAREMVKAARLNNGAHNLRVKIYLLVRLTPRSATRHTGTQANQRLYEKIQKRHAGFAAASGSASPRP